MTTLTVIAKIKKELDDQGIFYTDEDIFDSLQDGYDELALTTECIEKVVSVAFPLTAYVDMVSIIPDYFKVFAIYNPNRKEFLTPVGFKHLESISDKWETESGTPQWFVPIDFKYIALYPYYTVAPTQNMYVFYSAQAPDFTSSSTLELPSNHQSCLEDYVVGDLLEQGLEFKKSLRIYQDYIKGVARIKLEMNIRQNSDRVKQLMVQINANMG